jgi:cystathionine beta-synthase
MIGNTPVLKANRLDTGKCELYLKLENQNPGGSIKDRIGLSMITEGEKQGKIKEGTVLVEATAGNTGLGLALVARSKGYRLMLVIPDKMSQEKIVHLKAMGAEIIMTRSDVSSDHPEFYINLAKKITAETPNSYHIHQFANPANPLAHELTTGPEILSQMNGDVDSVVCGIGSGGTITGLSKYFQKHKPDLEMILADPVGSNLADYVNTGKYGSGGSYVVEGIGGSKVPEICDLSRTKKGYYVSDEESLHVTREILLKEGVIAGSSSGTLVAAALKYCKEQDSPKKVLTFICDSGNKYLSKVFNDYWMLDNGFLKRESFGDLRDINPRQYARGDVITVKPAEQLIHAYTRMKLYEISQLPVMDGKKIVGIIDESDILFAAYENGKTLHEPVSSVMTSKLEIISPRDTIEKLFKIFHADMVAILCEGEDFIGLITKIDLLNYLRRKSK